MDDIAGRTRREQLRAALKTAASALANAGIGFALAGGYALWAHGAPEPDHDVDFLVAADDASAAAEALAEAGFAVEQPPENWLFKAHLGSVFVDILHTVNGVAVTSELLGTAECQDVLAVRMPVLPPTRVIIQKLRALDEHNCDFATVLPAVRAIRETLRWKDIRAETADHDYAAAFLLLADRLRLTGDGEQS